MSYVVVFDDDRGAIVCSFAPTHCRGTDYTVDSVPERAVVQSAGGRTAIVGDPKDHHTRELIAKIAGSQS